MYGSEHYSTINIQFLISIQLFTPKRSTSDIIRALRFHHATALRYQEELFIIGMDFSKAFDTIDRSKLVNTILPPLLDEDELRLIR